jgi:hypothetical protein
LLAVHLDEEDERVLREGVGGRVGRVRQELVLGHHERVLEVVHVLEGAARRGLDEPDALARAVHHQVPLARDSEPPGDGVVAHERGGQRALDGPGGHLGVGAGAALEDVEGLDERALRRVAVEPGERQLAAGRGRRRGHHPLRHARDRGRRRGPHGGRRRWGIWGGAAVVVGARTGRLWLTWEARYDRSGVL